MRSIAPAVIGDRYEVGELLGRGGMADVYAGVDRRLERPVAIKLLQERMAARADVRTRFEAEAKAAATLTQPHAVAVYDTGEHEGVPFIVMERLPGHTLADRIAAGPLPVDDVRAVAVQVLGALGAAHAAGIVHRDVKPGNVLVAVDGSVKISDFGIAKSVDVVSDLTGTGQVLGTPAYLAPELIEGAPASPSSDLYALGVLLYEALAGRKPFAGTTPVAVAQAVVDGTHRPVSDLRPDVDKPLAEAVERAMSRDPERRFPSAATMAAALSVLPATAVSNGVDDTLTLDATSILTPAPPAPAGAKSSPLVAGSLAAAGAAGAETVEAPAATAAGAAGAPGAAIAAGAAIGAAGAAAPGGTGVGPAGAAEAGRPATAPRATAPPATAPPAPPATAPPAPRRRLGRSPRPEPGDGRRSLAPWLLALAGAAVILLLVLARAFGWGAGDGLAGSTTSTTRTPALAALADRMRELADGLSDRDGDAAPELAEGMRDVADQLDRGSGRAAASDLLDKVVAWQDDGDLTDRAALTAIGLLTSVPGVSAPTTAAPATEAPTTEPPTTEVPTSVIELPTVTVTITVPDAGVIIKEGKKGRPGRAGG